MLSVILIGIRFCKSGPRDPKWNLLTYPVIDMTELGTWPLQLRAQVGFYRMGSYEHWQKPAFWNVNNFWLWPCCSLGYWVWASISWAATIQNRDSYLIPSSISGCRFCLRCFKLWGLIGRDPWGIRWQLLIVGIWGTSLVVQWLRLCLCLGSIPGCGTRSHMLQLRPSVVKQINKNK